MKAPFFTIIIAPALAALPYLMQAQGRTPATTAEPVQAEHLHAVAYCFDAIETVPAPKIIRHNEVLALTAPQEEAFTLHAEGLTGYFAPAHWTVEGPARLETAPNGQATLVATGAGFIQLHIALPADGYATVEWVAQDNAPLWVQGAQATEGQHLSDALDMGGRLTLGFDAPDSGTYMHIVGFRYLTNAIGLVRRSWSVVGTGEQIDQLITIERPTVAHIYFPEAIDFSHFRVKPDPSLLLPASTGYPVLDRDGNLATLADQYRLDETACAYQVTWKDEYLTAEGMAHLLRHWTVRDRAAQNQMAHTQIITLHPADQTTPIPHVRNTSPVQPHGIAAKDTDAEF